MISLCTNLNITLVCIPVKPVVNFGGRGAVADKPYIFLNYTIPF